MADPFLGEIRAFPWDFAPRGWALCDGSVLPIAQYTALFALIGTYYGGDGKANFGLPDLRGRAMLHMGIGSDTIAYAMGDKGGAETVPLSSVTLPQHNHLLQANGDPADKAVPAEGYYLAQPHLPGGPAGSIYAAFGNPVDLADGSIGNTGSNEPHPNIQPSLVLNYCIATMGVFPSRS